jgi:hypothetical protein
MGRSQYIRKIAEGLDYEEARKFRDAKVNDRLPLPMGFSRNEGTVRNSIDVALDQMDDPKLGNFHDARVSHNVRVMAALYRKYVLSYKKPNWEINTSYSGQLGYFADVGGIGVVIKRFENALRKTDMTVPVAMLLFALPELIDQNNPEALRLKEFRGNNSAFNTEPSLLQASLIRSLFGKAPQRTVSRISWKDNVGGIDLAAAGAGLEVNSTKDIRFHLDPAMLQQLQNNPGFVPVIINTRPVTDLRMFLGIIAPVRVDKSA